MSYYQTQQSHVKRNKAMEYAIQRDQAIKVLDKRAAAPKAAFSKLDEPKPLSNVPVNIPPVKRKPVATKFMPATCVPGSKPKPVQSAGAARVVGVYNSNIRVRSEQQLADDQRRKAELERSNAKYTGKMRLIGLFMLAGWLVSASMIPFDADYAFWIAFAVGMIGMFGAGFTVQHLQGGDIDQNKREIERINNTAYIQARLV